MTRSHAGFVALLLPAVAAAHHSRVDFDTSAVVEVEGELVGVEWRNPHPSFSVRAVNAQGEDQLWEIEGSAIYVIERSGITGDAFPVGETVRVAGWQSRLDPQSLYITNMLLPGGAELVLLPSGNNRWSDEFTGGEWLQEAAAGDSRSLFRTWSTESYDVFVQASFGIEVQPTEAARTIMADAEDLDPCIAQGMPAIMVNPLPIDFVDHGDRIDLQLATFGVLRNIDMVNNADAGSMPQTDLGYSRGRWLGDTLEVRTSRIGWPFFDDAGTPQSENVEILETFTPAGNGNRLDYTMVVTDVESFTEPVTLSWYWVDTGEQMFLDNTCPDYATAADLTLHQERAREFLRELIEIDTTHSTGDTTLASQAMANHLLAAGFPEDDVQILEEVTRKGNLVVRYRGRDAGLEPILLLAHLDVVEADPSDWSLDPFTFIERDGFFYGRGTADDKDEAAIHVANLIRFKEEGFVPDRDIIIALTADEEGGDYNGVAWLVDNHRDSIDSAFALNEGGGGTIKDGRHLANYVQASEKVYQSFTLEVTNPGGHSSLPVRENAIYRLADALTRIRDYDFPVGLNEVTRTYFERSAALEESEVGAAMRGILQEPPDAASVALLSTLPAYNSRMRTTCVATLLDAGHAENALPQRAQAVVNCRILPNESPADVQRTLETVIADSNVSVTPVGEATLSPPSPLTAEVLGAIERITEDMWPGVPVVPIMSAGATDGLYLRNAGIPVYGVSGLFSIFGDNRAHGRDERILVSSYFDAQEFLYRLTKALATAD